MTAPDDFRRAGFNLSKVKREQRKAAANAARKQQHTHPRSKERKAQNAAIVDYLARNPPKAW